jgi:macrodomain Ter protein organizer (MatP/YcbG family)
MGCRLWWIGDWVNFGERKYGEEYAQALDATNYDYGTLRNQKWVASRFVLSRRHDNLSFSHHQEVAAMDEEQADKLLSQAEAEGWTRTELREIVHHDKWLAAAQNGVNDESRDRILSIHITESTWQKLLKKARERGITIEEFVQNLIECT